MCLVRLNIALGHFRVSPFTTACVYWDCDSPEAVDGHRSKARSQDEAQVSRLHEMMPATGAVIAIGQAGPGRTKPGPAWPTGVLVKPGL